ncbi:MAG: DUF6567 family protein [Bacteroidota bacterium]
MKTGFFSLLLVSVLLTGCSNTGAFLSANQTLVNLNEGNYSLSERSVTGESEAAYVLGLSYSTGLMASTIAIARVDGSEALYADAITDLWDNYEAEHGAIEGEKLALTNIRYDTDILNLILYTKVRLTIRADVIEFD